MLLIVSYLVLFLVVQSLTGKIKVAKKRLFLQRVYVFLLLIAFFAFRDLTVLNDTVNYYEDMIGVGRVTNTDSIFEITFPSITEPGFQVIRRFLLKYIWSDPYVLIITSSIFFSFFIVWFVGKYTDKYIPFVVFIFLGLSDMFQFYAAIRQGTAACLFFYAYYILDKKNKKVLPFIIVLLAITMHKSAIVCLIPLILSLFPFTKKNILFFLIVLTTIVVSFQTFMFILDYGESKYLDDSEDNVSKFGIPLAAILIAVFYSFLAWLAYRVHKKYHLAPVSSIMSWTVVVGLCFAVGAIPILVLTRFSLYFCLIILLFFIQEYSQVPFGVYNKVKRVLVILLILRTMVVIELRNEWYNLVPYGFYDFKPGIHDTSFKYSDRN